MKAFKFKYNDSHIIDRDVHSMWLTFMNVFNKEDAQVGEKAEIEVIEISEEEYKHLPEFKGF